LFPCEKYFSKGEHISPKRGKCICGGNNEMLVWTINNISCDLHHRCCQNMVVSEKDYTTIYMYGNLLRLAPTTTISCGIPRCSSLPLVHHACRFYFIKLLPILFNNIYIYIYIYIYINHFYTVIYKLSYL